MDKEILLQKCLERAVEEEEIAGGCILVNREGQEICYLESGWANREERRPISRNTIYHLFFNEQADYCCSCHDTFGRGSH